MNKLMLAALTLAFTAAPALAEETASSTPATTVVATKGKMLVAADGARLAPVYRVGAAGPQIIFEGRMVTVPSDSLAMVNGKLTTSLSKSQVAALQ